MPPWGSSRVQRWTLVALVPLLVAWAGCLDHSGSGPHITRLVIGPAAVLTDCDWRLPDGEQAICAAGGQYGSQVPFSPSVPASMACMIGHTPRPNETGNPDFGWWHGPPVQGDQSGPRIVQGISYHRDNLLRGTTVGLVRDLKGTSKAWSTWTSGGRGGFVQLPYDGTGKDPEFGGVMVRMPPDVDLDVVPDEVHVWWQSWGGEKDNPKDTFTGKSWAWTFLPVVEVHVGTATWFIRANETFGAIHVGSDHSGNAQEAWMVGLGEDGFNELDLDVDAPGLHGSIKILAMELYGWLDDTADPFWTTTCTDLIPLQQH